MQRLAFLLYLLLALVPTPIVAQDFDPEWYGEGHHNAKTGTKVGYSADVYGTTFEASFIFDGMDANRAESVMGVYAVEGCPGHEFDADEFNVEGLKCFRVSDTDTMSGFTYLAIDGTRVYSVVVADENTNEAEAVVASPAFRRFLADLFDDGRAAPMPGFTVEETGSSADATPRA